MSQDKPFDLFSGLASLSKGNKTWYDSLSPEGQKAAAPFVIARWMTGTSDDEQILKINTLVNPYLFSGTADKSTLFKLLAIAATGRSSRYSWLKAPGVKSKKRSIEVIKAYYDCSTREATSYKVAAEDLIEMAEELGMDKDEINLLKKECDDGSGTTSKEISKPKKRVVKRA